ncbi:GHKL domain-containing protein [Acidaminobacter sp. JC074]|uniref:sensor histidine kinase n=1 Tax=Acidaminobacter sp. JC074 TaxID=2530199 RepID=UPI001F10058F|nr:GHKL domain-containing protein [Acidaminobacter sp. JC074]MCH4890291.1 GHKL domain-containing protein [Acidaminobacter sp. JC074]
MKWIRNLDRDWQLVLLVIIAIIVSGWGIFYKYLERGVPLLFAIVFIIGFILFPIIQLILLNRLDKDLKGHHMNASYEIGNQLYIHEREHITKEMKNIYSMYETHDFQDILDRLSKLLEDQEEEIYSSWYSLDQVINYYQRMVKINGIKLNIALIEDVEKVCAAYALSFNALNTILGNFLDNAIEALNCSKQNNPEITFEILKNGSSLVVKVSNNGDMIFDTKHILKPGYSTKGTNRGIGLPIVCQVVNKLDGVLDIDSNIEFTSFSVILDKEVV